jgi:hypothetical protein
MADLTPIKNLDSNSQYITLNNGISTNVVVNSDSNISYYNPYDCFYRSWQSANIAAPHWIYIGYPDLNINFTEFVFTDFSAYGLTIANYQIQVSLDAKEWKTVYTSKAILYSYHDDKFSSNIISKYIRLYVLSTSSDIKWAGITDVKIYGDIAIPEYKYNLYKDKEDYLYGYK